MSDILDDLRAAIAEGAGDLAERCIAEIEDLRSSAIAFGGLWAAQYGRDCGWPDGHLHPTHYDILANAGARMVDFTRHEEPGT